jgi:hypothetical protein
MALPNEKHTLDRKNSAQPHFTDAAVISLLIQALMNPILV